MSHSRCSRSLILAMILAWPFTDGVVRALQAQVDGAAVLGGEFGELADAWGAVPRSRLGRVARDGAILPGAIGSATVGAAYQALFAMSGALGVVRFSTDSRLPAGVTLSSLGVLSGVPIETGIFPLTIVATDASSGLGASVNVSLAVGCALITLSSAAFPAAMRGVPYSPIRLGQSGGIGAALFAVVGGSLPPGLVLSTAGEVTGTPMEAGVFTALVRATDTNGCSGQSEYVVTVNAAPAIGTHPVDRVAAAGTPIVFTAAASGHPSPTYRWQVSTTNGATWSDVPLGAPYSGAGAAALSVTARAEDSGHQYRVLAINSVGTAISAAATLTVHTAPAIAAEPTDHIAVAGTIATFAVSATGNPVPSYRWQISTGSGASWTDLSDGSLYSGTTTGMLIIASVDPALDGSRYRAVAANRVGSTTSRGAALRVYSALGVPAREQHPPASPALNAAATTVADREVLWTGHEDGSLFRTSDSSSAQPLWRAAGTFELPEPVTALPVDPFDGNVADAAFGRVDHGDLWKTHDGGFTRTPLAAGGRQRSARGPRAPSRSTRAALNSSTPVQPRDCSPAAMAVAVDAGGRHEGGRLRAAR